MFNSSAVKIDTVFIKDRCTFFEMVSDLNIIIITSTVKPLILDNFKRFLN